jgi:hypothetical protein
MPIHTPERAGELPVNAPALPLVLQALAQAGAAGATLDELLDALRADGYRGDRMEVWAVVCEAVDQGAVRLVVVGRAHAAGYEP